MRGSTDTLEVVPFDTMEGVVREFIPLHRVERILVMADGTVKAVVAGEASVRDVSPNAIVIQPLFDADGSVE